MLASFWLCLCFVLLEQYHRSFIRNNYVLQLWSLGNPRSEYLQIWCPARATFSFQDGALDAATLCKGCCILPWQKAEGKEPNCLSQAPFQQRQSTKAEASSEAHLVQTTGNWVSDMYVWGLFRSYQVAMQSFLWIVKNTPVNNFGQTETACLVSPLMLRVSSGSESYDSIYSVGLQFTWGRLPYTKDSMCDVQGITWESH